MTNIAVGLDTSGIWKGPDAARAQGEAEQSKLPSLDGVKTLLHKALGQLGKLEEAQESGLVLPLSKIEASDEMRERLVSSVNMGSLPHELIDGQGHLTTNTRQASELLSTGMMLSQRDDDFAEKFATAIFENVAAKGNAQLDANLDNDSNNARFIHHGYVVPSELASAVSAGKANYGNVSVREFTRLFPDIREHRNDTISKRVGQYFMFKELGRTDSPDLSKIQPKNISDLKRNAQQYIKKAMRSWNSNAGGVNTLLRFINNISSSRVLMQEAPLKKSA